MTIGFLLSRNSNSMAYSLGVAAGFKEYLDNLNFGPETAGFKMLLHPGWRNDLLPYFADFPIDIPTEKPAPAPLWNQNGLNDTPPRKRSDGRDVQLASYRYAPSDDSAPRTVTPAMRELNAAKADDAFTKRYLNSERDAVEQMHALHRAAYAEPGNETVGPAVRREASDNSAGGYSQGTRDLTPARQALEAAKSDSGFVKRYLDGDCSAFDHMQSLIQAAYPEPDASSRGDAANGTSAPMFQPWTPEAATEGLAPWMQSSLKDYLSRSPDEEGDGSSKLAPWLRDQYPDWLRGS